MQKTATCFLFIILVTAFSTTLKAQNLVPNPSFEIFDTCPNTIGEVNRAQGWSSFGNTSDYFNSCAGASCVNCVPQNFIGNQLAATGNAYCGLFTRFVSPATYREYVGSQLTDTLQINHKYFVSFKVAATYQALYWCFTDKVGVLFSTVSYSVSSPPPLNNFAHVYSHNIISDTLNWTTVSGTFIADSNYKYIIIGNFFDNNHTDTLTTCANGYVYIDDISVSLDSSTCNGLGEGIRDYKNSSIQIYPNPAQNQIEIKADDIQSLTLYDVLGRVIYISTTEISSPFQLNTSSFLRGVYFLQVRGRGGMVVRKIVLD